MADHLDYLDACDYVPPNMISTHLFAFVCGVLGAGNVDLAALSPTQKQAFERVTQEEFCGCDSALTLAGCLELRPDCRIGMHLGQTIVRALEQGGSADDVLTTLSHTVLGPFCSRSTAINGDGAPTIGPKDAPFTIVEFADFRCWHCKRASILVKDALKTYGQRVRLVFVPFPLQDNPESMAAAEAVLAAAAQDKFLPMHDALFAHQGTFDAASLKKMAQRAGLNVQQFEKDMQARRFLPTVQSLKKAGAAAGVQGTPAFFVNGRRFELDPPLYTFGHRFAMEADRNQGNCQ